MKSTILMAAHIHRQQPIITPLLRRLLDHNEIYLQSKCKSLDPPSMLISFAEKYHRGRLETHAQQEMLDHNERIKKLIPAEQLLVYEVGEGWQRLVNFLGVYVPFFLHLIIHRLTIHVLCNSPAPPEPFPHVNDPSQFLESLNNGLS